MIEVAVNHPLYPEKVVSTTVGVRRPNTLEVMLLGGGTIEGFVRLNGEGVPDQRVTLNMKHRNFEERITDTSGHFQWDGLPDGDAKLHVNVGVEGFHGWKETAAETQDGAVTSVDFDFSTGRSVIEGTVYSAPGVSAGPGVHVSVRVPEGADPNNSYSQQTDARGFYRIERLPAGKVTLRAYSPTFGQKAFTLDVGDADRVRQDIELYGGADVRVSVSGSIRSRNSAVQVHIVYGHATEQELTPDAVIGSPLSSRIVGTLRTIPVVRREAIIPNVDPGDYWLVVTAHDPDDVMKLVQLNRNAQLGAVRIHVEETQGVEVRVPL
jgi:hypothetical protein